jgi:hypothetical protein
MLGGLSVLGLQLALFGTSPWAEWISALPAFRQTLIDGDLLWLMISPAGMAEYWGLPPFPFWMLGGLAAVAAIVALAKRAEGFALVALITLASLIASPYAILTDLVAVVPFIAALCWSQSNRNQANAVSVGAVAGSRSGSS